MEHRATDLLTAPHAGTADRAASAARAVRPPVDVTRIVTTTEVVVGAVLVARHLSRRPGSSKAVVSMGPGGWVSMKGGTVALRRASRPWGRSTPVRPASTGDRAPLWPRVLSAVPLHDLVRAGSAPSALVPRRVLR